MVHGQGLLADPHDSSHPQDRSASLLCCLRELRDHQPAQCQPQAVRQPCRHGYGMHPVPLTVHLTDTAPACRIALQLRNLGFGAVPIHGQMSQPKRIGALHKFKSGDRSILVATGKPPFGRRRRIRISLTMLYACSCTSCCCRVCITIDSQMGPRPSQQQASLISRGV